MRMWNVRSAGRPMSNGNFLPLPPEDAADPVRGVLPERARGDRSGRHSNLRVSSRTRACSFVSFVVANHSTQGTQGSMFSFF